jgi:DNA-binding MarR family transcriptional regulator
MQMRLEAEMARDLAADSELSLPDYGILIFLTDQPEGRLRLYELVQGLGWEQSRVSKQVSRMQERGLVEKVRCSTDRRGWHVQVTDEGRKAIEAAAPSHLATVRRSFIDHVSPEELEVIADVAERVLEKLNGSAVSPPG